MVEMAKGRRNSLMAKPIEATPVLRGEDAVEFLKSIEHKKPTDENKRRRKEAVSLLRKAMK